MPFHKAPFTSEVCSCKTRAAGEFNPGVPLTPAGLTPCSPGSLADGLLLLPYFFYLLSETRSD
jgi:hypothetical protein